MIFRISGECAIKSKIILRANNYYIYSEYYPSAKFDAWGSI